MHSEEEKMDFREAFARLEDILGKAKIGMLATVDENGAPCLRWMTPVIAKGREGCLYALTSPKFRKCKQVEGSPQVAWSIQTRTLDEIVVVRGMMNLIQNPQLVSEITERIGRNLEIFWRVNPSEADLVVMETEIEEIEYFQPLKGLREYVTVERRDR